MLQKAPNKGNLLNKFQKGFVLGCLGLTLYGLATISLRTYQYYYIQRPEALRQQALEERRQKEELPTSEEEVL